ncbi:hypothetical protein QQF64_035497 [Cirrhinus molitorella]|uniref:Uncharacterized protein n=1 Tax=Cirrhinus molitorella TaxID=172907 RepID=A0ABR3NG58_9TELE
MQQERGGERKREREREREGECATKNDFSPTHRETDLALLRWSAGGSSGFSVCSLPLGERLFAAEAGASGGRSSEIQTPCEQWPVTTLEGQNASTAWDSCGLLSFRLRIWVFQRVWAKSDDPNQDRLQRMGHVLP